MLHFCKTKFACGLFVATAICLLSSNGGSNSVAAHPITAIGKPAFMAVQPYKRLDATWFFGGMTILAFVTEKVCTAPANLVVPYAPAVCTASVAVLAIAGLATAIGGLASKRDVADNWVISHPQTHPRDGVWREIGTKNAGGSSFGTVWFMHNETEGIKGVSASIQTDDKLALRQTENSGSKNGLTLDYFWKADSTVVEQELADDSSRHHDLDQGYANMVSNTQTQAQHTGYWCAGATVSGKQHEATQGAFFQSTGSYPYQPGQAQAVVNGCHQGI